MELTALQLKKSGFEAACNSAFSVSGVDQPASGHQLTLTALQSHSAPPGFEQFSLMFQGPLEPLLPQGTYCFWHDRLGELPLFMVPVGKSTGGVQYEVCISRSTENDGARV